MRVTYVLLARIPAKGAANFQLYETAVLPLLTDHQGTLERRLHSNDERTEVHIASLPTTEHFERYRNDPRRVEHTHLLQESNARVEIYAMADVTVPSR